MLKFLHGTIEADKNSFYGFILFYLIGWDMIVIFPSDILKNWSTFPLNSVWSGNLLSVQFASVW